MVCGTSGSGKSTVSRELARRLGAEYVELDALWHEPNWKEAEIPVFRARVSDAISADRWVVDGNYRQARDLVIARCDTIVWLDYPLPLILWRLTGRTLRRGITRQELWNGNCESAWRHFFTRESLYIWVFKTFRKRRAEGRAIEVDPEFGHLNRFRARSPREMRRWLSSCLLINERDPEFGIATSEPA